ncbi:hypothetical protein [Kitasatospora sp. NPDC089509]|uniref:hypothetical protein n=1 Tax=Kitasatospora sp. NPDC089509 TaxID=3364079 RepID=UPI003822EDE3
MVAAAAVALLTPSTAFAAPSSGATAPAPGDSAVEPFSAHGCSGLKNRVCIQINGSGLFVKGITGTAMEIGPWHAEDEGYMEVNGPDGVVLRGPTMGWSGVTVSWSPMANVKPGKYCVTAYKNGKRWDGACKMVHK